MKTLKTIHADHCHLNLPFGLLFSILLMIGIWGCNNNAASTGTTYATTDQVITDTVEMDARRWIRNYQDSDSSLFRYSIAFKEADATKETRASMYCLKRSHIDAILDQRKQKPESTLQVFWGFKKRDFREFRTNGKL